MSPLREFARRVQYAGLARYCPLCRAHVRLFHPHGVVPRPNAVCPVCLSRDRHRLAWLWLREKTKLGKAPMRLLHVAPEAVVAKRLQALPNLHYISGDIVHKAHLRMDVCKLPFPNASFDFVYCSHVLNMVPDDRPAIAELFRILRPGAMVLLQVPTARDETTIELSLQSVQPERLAALGDADMYRRYGQFELTQRMGRAGFAAEAVAWFQQYEPAQQQRLGLIDEPLHIGTKPITT
jgi:SAM-dependent methyltransferase